MIPVVPPQRSSLRAACVTWWGEGEHRETTAAALCALRGSRDLVGTGADGAHGVRPLQRSVNCAASLTALCEQRRPVVPRVPPPIRFRPSLFLLHLLLLLLLRYAKRTVRRSAPTAASVALRDLRALLSPAKSPKLRTIRSIAAVDTHSVLGALPPPRSHGWLESQRASRRSSPGSRPSAAGIPATSP